MSAIETEIKLRYRLALDNHGDMDKRVWEPHVKIYENDLYYATYLRYQEFRAGFIRPEYEVIREIDRLLGFNLFEEVLTDNFPIKLSTNTLKIFEEGGFVCGDNTTAVALYLNGLKYTSKWFAVMMNKQIMNKKIVKIFDLLSA